MSVIPAEAGIQEHVESWAPACAGETRRKTQVNGISAFKMLLLFLLACAAAPCAALEIKFATLAPEGTDAMQLMHAVDAELREKTRGELGFKFYSGGRQGDEKDIVRKIRLGQLHAGGFTGVGLGEIAPQVRILDAPWLLHDAAEADYVYKTFSKDFERAFEKEGYVLLGWTEVGFVHIFSKEPVRAAADLRKLKLWVWEGDPLAQAAFQALGAHPIPLSITDVNSSLQTGFIDAVYASPLYAIALQWHEKTRYVFSLPLADASGAVLISKSVADALPKEQRRLLLEVSRRHLRTLNAITRRRNAEALRTLQSRGMILTAPLSAQEENVFEEAGRSARKELAGKLYSADFLQAVERSLADLRRKKTSPRPS
ncbi:MAG: TRAP transporter substrate-binding protein DctP [Elusimicrobiota bacterium]|jgi:TRAP-type C4-dicarboxylate transport system substrate-binding protein